MIYAEFTTDADRKKIVLKVNGHANAAPKGTDLICASASILAYTLAQNIKYARLRGLCKYEPEIRLKNGDAKITVRAKDTDSYAELCAIYCVIQTGYQLLAQNYPDFVVVRLFGEEDN